MKENITNLQQEKKKKELTLKKKNSNIKLEKTQKELSPKKINETKELVGTINNNNILNVSMHSNINEKIVIKNIENNHEKKVETKEDLNTSNFINEFNNKANKITKTSSVLSLKGKSSGNNFLASSKGKKTLEIRNKKNRNFSVNSLEAEDKVDFKNNCNNKDSLNTYNLFLKKDKIETKNSVSKSNEFMEAKDTHIINKNNNLFNNVFNGERFINKSNDIENNINKLLISPNDYLKGCLDLKNDLNINNNSYYNHKFLAQLKNDFYENVVSDNYFSYYSKLKESKESKNSDKKLPNPILFSSETNVVKNSEKRFLINNYKKENENDARMPFSYKSSEIISGDFNFFSSINKNSIANKHFNQGIISIVSPVSLKRKLNNKINIETNNEGFQTLHNPFDKLGASRAHFSARTQSKKGYSKNFEH